MKKTTLSIVILVCAYCSIHAQNAGGIYAGANTLFPDFKTDDGDSYGIGAELGLQEAFRKKNIALLLRAGFLLNNSHHNFYNGGLGAGTSYDVDITAYSFHPGVFIPVFFGTNKHTYLSPGISSSFTFYRQIKGTTLSHFLSEVEEGEINRRDTEFFNAFIIDLQLGVGYNHIMLMDKTAFIEVNAAHALMNEYNEDYLSDESKSFMFSLLFGIDLF